MKGYKADKASEQYLLQRIQAASPEQMVALLLEGGQRFTKLAVEAIHQRNFVEQARYTNRVGDIILELRDRLNHKDGGETVQNLIRVYDWWVDAVFRGAQQGEVEVLERVISQMGEFRETWEELHRRKTAGGQPPVADGSRDFSV